MGLWRGVGDAPYGSVFRISWSAPTAFRHTGSAPLAAAAPAPGDEEPGTPSAGASRRTSGTGGATGAAGAGRVGGGGGGHVEVVALRGGKGLTELAQEVTARVGPSGTAGVSLQLVDESLAILKDKPWRRMGGPGGAGGPSAAALAAAAVATGTHALSIRDRSGTSPAAAGSSGGGVMAEHPLGLLGASPPKSFGYEMLRFMAGSVAGSRSSGRKKDKRGVSGGMGGGGGGGPAGGGVRRQAAILQHLVRLKVAAPSRQRPMSGVWSGVYGPHGVEVVSLGYEGTGSRARLVATKVTANPGLELANAVAAAMAEAEAAAAAAAAGTAAPAVAPPGVVAVPPGLLVAPAGMQVAPPMWAMPGAAAAAGQAAAAAAAAQPAPLAVHPPPQPDAGMGAGVGALDPQAAIQAQLAATAAAAAAAEPADLWALLRPPPPPPGMPAASMSRTGSTTAVGLAGMGGQEAVAPATEVVAGVAGAQEAPAGTGAAATRRTPLRVVAIYKGQGRVAGAGFSNPAWIDGRLWVYDNGRIGFLWQGDFDFIVDLERLSATVCGLDLSGSTRA
eukprot:XP_001697213.1 predicted protein [Chlamydomonas reinhardtii]